MPFTTSNTETAAHSPADFAFSPDFAAAVAAADQVGRMYRLTADLHPEVHAATFDGVVETTVERYEDSVRPLERNLTPTEVRMVALFATAHVSARHAGRTDLSMRQQVFQSIHSDHTDPSLWSGDDDDSPWFRAALADATQVRGFYQFVCDDFPDDLDLLRQALADTVESNLLPYRPLLTACEWTDLLALALTGSSTHVDWVVGQSVRSRFDASLVDVEVSA